MRSVYVFAIALISCFAISNAAKASQVDEIHKNTYEEYLRREKSLQMQEQLVAGIFTEKCFDTFFVQFNILDTPCIAASISKLLSFAIIAGAGLLKVPQFMNFVISKDTTGVSLLSLYFDVAAFLPAPVFNILNGNAFSTFGEALVVLVENCILVITFWVFCKPAERPSPVGMAGVVCCGVALTVAMALLPESLWWTMPVLGVLFTFACRIPQILTNFKNGHTGQLAVVTWLLNFVGALARVFTTMQDPGISAGSRPLLIGSFLIGAGLSFIVLLQIAAYWKTTKKVLAEGAVARAAAETAAAAAEAKKGEKKTK